MDKISIKIKILACTAFCLLLIAAYLFTQNTPKPSKTASSQSAPIQVTETKTEESSKAIAPLPKKVESAKKQTKDNELAAAEEKPAWVQAALDALKNPDIGIRMQAVMSLRNQTSPEAIELLEMFLDDQEQAVIAEALDTLGFIGLNSEHKAMAFEILAEKAQDENFIGRGNALITAALLDEEGQIFPIIGEYIAENDDASTKSAVRAMAFLDDPKCVPYLAKIAAESQDPEILQISYNVLAKIETDDALALLQDGVLSQERDKQASSVWALSRLNNEQHNEILADAMDRHKLGYDSLSIVAKSPAAPRLFGKALQRNDITTKEKIELLKVLDKNTINASGKVRNEIADTVKPLLNSPDPKLEAKAVETLGKLGAQEDHSETLAPKLESDNFMVQQAALQSFIQFCNPNNYKPLKKLWYHEDEKMRRTAFFFSEQFLNQSDMEDLQKATVHEDEFIAKHSKIMIKYLTK